MGTATTTTPAIDYVDPYPGHKGSDRIVETCGDCGGDGLYHAPTGWTDAKGRPYCFRCHGTGKRGILVSSARATARAQAKRRAAALVAAEHAAERNAREAAELEAKRTAFEAAHPAGVAWIRANATRSEFALDLLERLEADGDLSDNRIAAAERSAAADAARADVELAEGRRVLTGVVRSTKSVDGGFGYVHKMVLELEDGARVYGSIPTSLDPAVEALGAPEPGQNWYHRLVGQTVTLTATVQRSDREAAFGFYSRPVKAALVEAASA